MIDLFWKKKLDTIQQILYYLGRDKKLIEKDKNIIWYLFKKLDSYWFNDPVISSIRGELKKISREKWINT